MTFSGSQLQGWIRLQHVGHKDGVLACCVHATGQCSQHVFDVTLGSFSPLPEHGMVETSWTQIYGHLCVVPILSL